MFFYLFCVQGGYEAVPTRDIHMNQIGETTMQRFGSVGLDPNKIGKMRIKKMVATGTYLKWRLCGKSKTKDFISLLKHYGNFFVSKFTGLFKDLLEIFVLYFIAYTPWIRIQM